MKHRFSFWYDVLLPLIHKIVGHSFDCCSDDFRNCRKCLKEMAWQDEEYHRKADLKRKWME